MIVRTHLTRHRGRSLELGAAGALTVAMAATTLGLAATAGGSVPAPEFVKPPTAVHTSASADAASSSTYLAGYQSAPSGGLASASVTFTVPAYKCTPAEKSAGAFEANGVYTDSFATFAFVGAQCGSGGPTYAYYFEVGSSDFAEFGAAPGDVIVTSLSQSSSATWAKIHDLTNGDSWSADENANLGDTVADIGTLVDNTTEGLPVAGFTKAAFSDATVNGDDLGFESPTRVNALQGADVLLKTGALATTSAGSAFAVTFKRST
jgi:hypothetical protein